MSHGPDLPLPSARALQGWWRELAGLRPGRLWFGRLLFHHLDALVEIAHAAVLDPLQRVLLRAIAADAPLSSFDPQVRTRLLHELAHAGLLGAGGTNGSLSPAGRSAVATGSFTRIDRARRSFWFVDNTGCAQPPQFLLPQRPLESGATPDGWSFPPESLAEQVRRSAEWKQRHHFPEDVQTIVDLAAAPGDWRAVMLDRTEQFLGVVVEALEDSALTAYAVRPDTWGVECDAPAFTLSAPWQEVLPDLAVELSADDWRQAWLQWCQPRGLAEADACILEREGQRLLIRAEEIGRALADRPW